jgi:hypothetical protein
MDRNFFYLSRIARAVKHTPEGKALPLGMLLSHRMAIISTQFSDDMGPTT